METVNIDRTNNTSRQCDSRRFLSLREVSKSFGATKALDEVSIDFFKGEIHCLLGENGAGKSTVGKIIGGLYQHDKGDIYCNGDSVAFESIKDSRDRRIALVFQELSLAPHLSVRANLRLGVEGNQNVFSLIKHHEEVQEAKSILSELGFGDVDVEQPVQALPTALQQMVEIAKALAQSPELIVFDEPTATLGAVEKRKLFDVLRKQRDEGKAIIMITHHIEDVIEVADRISIMRDGKLVDSFQMSVDITADEVLERLAGKKVKIEAGRCAGVIRNEDLLHIENLQHYAKNTFTLRVRRGEIVGLYGVVGSGAEGLTRSLVGLKAKLPDLRFILEGCLYKPRSPAHAVMSGVSYLPSGRASNCVFPTLSIKENLSLSLLSTFGKYGVISQKSEQRRVSQLLERFRVKYASSDDLITSLSGGNQQKILIARAMMRAQKILVLEEPTAGVDIDAKLSIHEQIRSLTETGISVVLLSSDLVETLSLCDTIYTMYSGEIVNAYENPTFEDQSSIISDVLGQRDPSEQIKVVNF